MIESIHTYKIFIDSDKKEYATEEELKTESTSYPIDRCMSHVPRKRTFYSSNDNVIRDTLDRAKVERYEEEQTQKRHEAYEKLKDMYGKWYKRTDWHGEAYFMKPIALAKYKHTCGGKRLLVESCREASWAIYGVSREMRLRDIINFVNDIEKEGWERTTEDDVKMLLAREQEKIEKEYEEKINGLYDRIAGLQEEKVREMEKAKKGITYDKDEYIFYDENGKMIE